MKRLKSLRRKWVNSWLHKIVKDRIHHILYIKNSNIPRWYKYKSDPEFCDESIFKQNDYMLRDGDPIRITYFNEELGKEIVVDGYITKRNRTL